ncbi:glycosyltransferase [Christiangramia sp.]|uniref:glycosyltransferase n=1 Tax=Christiangramia sp. TaxID=1931228 RepID=UPI00260DC2D0|nr:glycosyltransferase [Christiangramia sp.]
MKILHIIHKIQNRGAEIFTCQLAYHLRDLGHEVKIVAVYSGEARLPFSPNIENLNASGFTDIGSWRKISKIIKHFNPDIIQANSGDTLKFLIISKIIFGWKVPVVFRNASEVGRYIKSYKQKVFNKFLYKNVDRVISVSEASKNDILSNFPFLKDKVEVIPVGLEMGNPIKEFIYEPVIHKHIVHVGGFSFEKNHKGLISIFKRVLDICPNTQLHLIGDGPLKNEIMNEIRKSGIAENINFHGFVDNPLDYIASADLLVLPSKIEGLPGVLLEAMYCKTPVIAYAVGGISEIVNKNTGYLIKYGKEQLFTDTIVNSLKKDNQCIINAAFDKVTKEFDNRVIAKSFIESYEILR